MTLKIDTTNAHEDGVHQFMAFASDLRLPPGSFPEHLETALGNGQPFVKQLVSEDFACVKYAQAFGCIRLTVINS